MNTYKKLFFLLSSSERKQAGLLLIMMIIMAMLDMAGIASILPFMAVLTNPSLIETNIILNTIFKALNVYGVETHKQFIFFLGLVVLVALIVSLTFNALTSYVQIRFVLMREYTIGKRLLEAYLYQPYTWFLSNHSADLGKTILSEVNHIINSGIRPLMDLMARSMVVIAILTLLIIVNIKIALIVGLSAVTLYVLIFFSVRKYLNKIGKVRLTNNQLRFTTVSEAFGAAKEIKLGRLEGNYIQNFSNCAKIFAQTQAYTYIISTLPRYVLEGFAFGGALLMILYMLAKTGNINDSLPIFTLYVFAGYRLMPAVQQIYNSLSLITFIGPSIDKLYFDFKNLKLNKKNNKQSVFKLKKSIILNNINFNYPNSKRKSLNNISLDIPVKSTTGFIGASGSGKTTIIDIILGLLEPQKGTLKIDGKTISKQNVGAWQQTIGYVPQHIFLADKTVAENIAFGWEIGDIKQDLVEKAAKIANLHEFVLDELPKQYQTTIGEQGVRLSGGQRQRIGIARALYNNPQVLILDEATSALDNETEEVVMEAVNNLHQEITIIMIAHRLKTVKVCDKIFLIDDGKLKNQGTFDELINLN